MDNDLWGHLYFGKEILQAGRLPHNNIYSFTVPDHPWINHEWLAEVLFYGIYSLLGSSGLIFLKVVVGGGIVWILNGILKKRTPSLYLRVITLVWVMAILSPGFNVRPQIFTYLLFTVFLFLFHRAQEKGITSIYGIPFLTALWVNLHGGFVAGIGALCLFVITVLVTPIWSLRETKLRKPSLVVVLVLGLVAMLVNPYGWRLIEFLWNDLRLDRPISEWDPVPIWGLSFMSFKLAVLVALISVRKESWVRWDWFLMLLTVFLAFQHQRHTPLFAIAAAPFMACGIERVVQWIKGFENEKFATTQLITARWTVNVSIVVLVILQSLWLAKWHMESRFRLVVSPLDYPTQATEFLKRNEIRGNMAVPFDWGEFFIWKLYPFARVSIDGRYTTAYPMEVIDDSWEWMKGGQEWKRLLEVHSAEIAVSKRQHPVTTRLLGDPEWVYIYSDQVSFIFIRATESQKSLLERFEAGKLHPPGTPSIFFPG